MQRVADELAHSLSSLERLRDNFEYKDSQGKDQVSRMHACTRGGGGTWRPRLI